MDRPGLAEVPNCFKQWTEAGTDRGRGFLRVLQTAPSESCGKPAQRGPAEFCPDLCLSPQPRGFTAGEECEKRTGGVQRTDEERSRLGSGRGRRPIRYRSNQKPPPGNFQEPRPSPSERSGFHAAVSNRALKCFLTI